MAQVYSFVDDNGVTRLFAEIVPDVLPASGGTLTAPAAAAEVLTLVPAVGAAAAHTDILDIQDELGVPWFEFDARHIVLADLSGAPSGSGFFTITNGGQILFSLAAANSTANIGSSSGRLGFYDKTPVALQTGVAVSAAGIHAALVNLGLITA